MLEREATPQDVAAVEAALSEAGIDGKVKANYMRKSAGLLPWALWIVVPAASLFLNGFLSEAGADAYRSLKSLILKLYEARRQSPAPKSTILLRDEGAHEHVLLDEDLPDKAWQTLFTIEIHQTESGTLRWDFKVEAWRDVWEIKD